MQTTGEHMIALGTTSKVVKEVEITVLAVNKSYIWSARKFESYCSVPVGNLYQISPWASSVTTTKTAFVSMNRVLQSI